MTSGALKHDNQTKPSFEGQPAESVEPYDPSIADSDTIKDLDNCGEPPANFETQAEAIAPEPLDLLVREIAISEAQHQSGASVTDVDIELDDIDIEPAREVEPLELEVAEGAAQEIEDHYPGVYALEGMEDLNLERWRELGIEERKEVLQEAERRLAKAQDRKPLPVYVEGTRPGLRGYCNGSKIVLGASLVANDDVAEVVSTLAHEGRHAYQFYAVNHPGFHPDAKEVAKWYDNFRSYKTVQRDGFRAYYNQPVEVDARTYAARVVQARYGGK